MIDKRFSHYWSLYELAEEAGVDRVTIYKQMRQLGLSGRLAHRSLATRPMRLYSPQEAEQLFEHRSKRRTQRRD